MHPSHLIAQFPDVEPFLDPSVFQADAEPRLTGLLTNILDSDLDHPHAWEMAERQLHEALSIVQRVNKGHDDARFAASMDQMDASVLQINALGRMA